MAWELLLWVEGRPSVSTRSAHTWHPYCGSGYALDGGPATLGLEPTSPGGAAPMGKVQESAGGPVCLPGQCTLPPVVLHVGATRASGLRCSGSRLAWAGALRIPPISPDPGCAGQEQDGRASSASGGPILAQMTLVQPSPVLVVWDILATSPETGLAVSGLGNSVASEAAPPQSVGWLDH